MDPKQELLIALHEGDVERARTIGLDLEPLRRQPEYLRAAIQAGQVASVQYLLEQNFFIYLAHTDQAILDNRVQILELLLAITGDNDPVISKEHVIQAVMLDYPEVLAVCLRARRRIILKSEQLLELAHRLGHRACYQAILAAPGRVRPSWRLAELDPALFATWTSKEATALILLDDLVNGATPPASLAVSFLNQRPDDDLNPYDVYRLLGGERAAWAVARLRPRTGALPGLIRRPEIGQARASLRALIGPNLTGYIGEAL